MTERTRLTSYLLYGLFSALLKMNTIKTTEGSNFPHPLARATASFVAHTKEVSVCQFFLQVIENIVVLCPSFLLFSPTRSQFYSQLKRAIEPRKNFTMPGHYLALINRAGGLYGRISYRISYSPIQTDLPRLIRCLLYGQTRNAREKSNDAYSLSIRVHTTKNHISIYFLP